MSEAPLLPIIAEISIAAPIEHVWDVLTSEATVPAWLGCMDYRAVVGATFFMQQDPEARKRGDTGGATHCTIALIDKPNKFTFSWFEPGTPETMVHISLIPDGPNKTLVRLMHEGWDQFAPDAVRPFYEQVTGGWKAYVLPGLKRAAEKR